MTINGPPSTDEVEQTDYRYVRRIEAGPGQGVVTLVGVVHGHPASGYRVQDRIERLAPDVVALELPSLALALATVRARDTVVPPRAGGEMSAAVQAASVPVVGIDAPSRTYLKQLLQYSRDAELTPGTLRGVLEDLGRSSLQALKWRLAATVEGRLGLSLPVGRSDDHEVDYDDSLDTVVENEARHVSITRTFRNAVTTPESVEIVDTVRERAMAERLDRLRADSDVLAVVGISHLDAIADRLRR